MGAYGEDQKILFPWSDAETKTLANDEGSVDVTIDNTLTILTLDSPGQATTINVTVGDEIRVGSMIMVDVQQGGTGQNISFGNNMVSQNITGVANDRDTKTFMYNGTEFVATGEDKPVDAA